ncbi:MAG: ABC transporter ATP-binding protein [Erysipelothrix sp.]|nr:ABC transporter ATP-binding protein [Erysipelothrix sp.]
MKNIVKVNNVQKYYGRKNNITKALNGVSFSIVDGEFVGIMGPSGSGKTTLLNCISTIDSPTSGDIIIADENISKLSTKNLQKFRSQSLGFIFQDYNLLDTITGSENIALPLSIANVKYSEIKDRVEKIAKILDIEHVIKKFPYQLSGGEKQRVAAARALVNNPKLILADEPTGSLDSKSSRMLLENLQSVNETLNTTIMMVTHDAFSASYCNRILFIKDGVIFNELRRGSLTRKEFFDDIISIMTLLGGDIEDVL